jgi:hypothetical protein
MRFSAVESGPHVGQAPDPLMQHLVQETNDAFWQATGYKPGHLLKYPDDAAMMPVWLTIHYAVITNKLNTAKMFLDADPVYVQRLADYQHQWAQRFAADPTIDQRAQDVMRRIRSR